MKKHRSFEMRWASDRWALFEGRSLAIEYKPTCGKRKAEKHARWFVRRAAPSQLRIKTKAGRIEKGGGGEASYSCDSPRRKG